MLVVLTESLVARLKFWSTQPNRYLVAPIPTLDDEIGSAYKISMSVILNTPRRTK